MNFDWLQTPVHKLDIPVFKAAQARQQQLTKPPGSLGSLELLAQRLAGMQSREKPDLDNIHITVFAADHGVAEEGVSAFPQEVTVEMIRNFSRGGAAICVLAKQLGASLEVVDVGAASDPGPLSGVVSSRVANGTRNFCQGAAMSEAQLGEALSAGRDAVQRALTGDAQLFIGGEMGIANTSSATALACAVLDHSPVQLAGPGTGLDSKGVSHKVQIIQQALDLHKSELTEPLQILRCLGGFEITALVGAYIAAAQAGLPIMVDGFISTSAALMASNILPGTEAWYFLGHASAEPGHAVMVQALNVEPILNLGMRLGEGSGAAVAVSILKHALALHNEMATFAEAGVSDGNEQ